MFNLTGVLKGGIGVTAAAMVATFVWSYLGGVAGASYGWYTLAALVKQAAVSAGLAGAAGLIVTLALAGGIFVFRSKLKLGKKKFIAW